MTDKTDALVLVRRSQLIELQAEVSDDASLAHERIRSILAAQPAGAVGGGGAGQREVVGHLYISDDNVQLCPIGAGKLPDKVIRKRYGNGTHDLVVRTTPPAASVDVEGRE